MPTLLHVRIYSKQFAAFPFDLLHLFRLKGNYISYNSKMKMEGYEREKLMTIMTKKGNSNKSTGI